MPLQKIALENFKGQSFELEFNRDQVKVYGKNATGKTSAFDAYCWLLLDQDSRGRSQFNLKPRDENGDVIHKKDVIVRAEIDTKLDGFETHTFEKVYKEKWREDRGGKEVLKGHKTDYYIDGTPLKANEYQSRLTELLGPSDRLALLVGPRAFQRIHWKKRREKLLELSEGLEAEDVIEANHELEGLELDGKAVKDKRKEVESKLKDLKEEKDKIPTKIETLREEAPEVDRDYETVVDSLDQAKAKKAHLEDELQELRSGSGLRKRKASIQAELTQVKERMIKEHRKEKNQLEDKVRDLNKQIDEKQSEYREKERRRSEKVKDIIRKLEKLESFREEYREKAEVSDTCPLCGQEIPEKLQAEVRKNQSEELEALNEKGRKLSEKLEDVKSEVRDLVRQKAELEVGIQELKEKREEAQNNLEDLPSDVKFSNNSEYSELRESLEEIERKITEDDNSEELESTRKQIAELDKEIDRLQRVKNRIEEKGRMLSRVDDLKSKKQELAGSTARLEKQLDLLDKFEREQAKMVEKQVNQLFESVNFKLFEPYKSREGLKEVCKITWKGVPWSTLNNGGRIRAGLSIIKTLRKAWGLSPITWVDNAESITNLPEVENMVALYVSQDYDSLKIEGGQYVEG